MRIAASLGVLVATSLLGHTAAQETDYGNPNGSPVGSSPGGSSNIIPGNTDGSGNPSYPSNAAGNVPGSLPSSAGPGSTDGGSDGLPLMDLVVSLVVFRETFLVALLSISLVLVRLSFLAAFLPMHLRTSLAHPVLPTLVSLTSPPVLSAPQRLLLSLSTQQTLRTDKISLA
ncbi:hypothetical protein NW765_004792 [Fusarium oxysporum]|nr:hypothetical protein NW765_004792 [Fusarium oxysporum]